MASAQDIFKSFLRARFWCALYCDHSSFSNFSDFRSSNAASRRWQQSFCHIHMLSRKTAGERLRTSCLAYLGPYCELQNPSIMRTACASADIRPVPVDRFIEYESRAKCSTSGGWIEGEKFRLLSVARRSSGLPPMSRGNLSPPVLSAARTLKCCRGYKQSRRRLAALLPSRPVQASRAKSPQEKGFAMMSCNSSGRAFQPAAIAECEACRVDSIS